MDIEKSINILDKRKEILFADIKRKSDIMFYYLSNCNQIPKKRTINYSDIMTELYPTNITKKLGDKSSLSAQDNSKLFTEHNNYIHSYFGL